MESIVFINNTCSMLVRRAEFTHSFKKSMMLTVFAQAYANREDL